MRVTIGQINTTNGDYEGNTEKILRADPRLPELLGRVGLQPLPAK